MLTSKYCKIKKLLNGVLSTGIMAALVVTIVMMFLNKF